MFYPFFPNRGRHELFPHLLLSTFGLVLAEKIFADPYGLFPQLFMQARTVKITGNLVCGKKGLANIIVSDGLKTVQTDANGHFELISNSHQPFVFFSIPAGYRIPQNPMGTARFYQPIEEDRNGIMTVLWELEKFENDEHHGFVVMADPQTRDEFEMNRFLNETIRDIKTTLTSAQKQNFFSVTAGDIVFDNQALYPSYKRGIRSLGLPAFQVVGNHDVQLLPRTGSSSIQTFMNHFGPSYYSFNRGAVHYVVLDDVFFYGEGYLGYIDQAQLDWLKQDLQYLEPGQKVVVFTHIPLYQYQHVRDGKASPAPRGVVSNRQMLYQLLAPFDAHFIAGHTHQLEHLVDGGFTHHICGAVCGAWWSSNISYDGSPNGYAIYQVKGDELTSRYKAVGHPIDHQMRLYSTKGDQEATLTANVWDAHSGWQITWHEDGMRKGAMECVTGPDPMSAATYADPSKFEKSRWVRPQNTQHLYTANIAKETKEVVVEAVDAGGQTYCQRLIL